MEKKINVTQPAMPPLEEYVSSLEKIWDNKVLTNNGCFHRQLEKDLKEYLNVDYLSLFCNGTIALLTAIQALCISGEVITTPYTFVATAHSLLWNNIKPVFIDVDPYTFNLNPECIEAAITENTSAIMPVHVYGVPCNNSEIERIAAKYNLKVIYDAAHAFGVKENGNSILNYGDLSILSFHATKSFTTIEGGGIISHSKEMKDRVDKLKNFGFTNETTVLESGINGKMNEFQAAFGSLYLKYFDSYLEKRKVIANRYDLGLDSIPGISVRKINDAIDYNYSYYPILIDYREFNFTRDEVYNYLKGKNIYCRRYFYPLVTDFPMYNGSVNLDNARVVSDSVLCLPIYPDLDLSQVDMVVNLLKDLHNTKRGI